MTISDVLNLVAIIVAPVAAVLIGQWLQNRANKRKDKLEIFKTLMIARNGWIPESVRARWKEYYDRLCVENPSETELKKIKTAQDKLLGAMAISLGYKDKVTWETIQNPYVPKGMIEAEQMQREYQTGQLAWAQIAKNFNSSMIPGFMQNRRNPTVRRSSHDQLDVFPKEPTA